MAGVWGCFDDFNRVDVEVLSVAAQLIENLLMTKKEQKRLLDLTAEPGNTGVSPECGIFCTQARYEHMLLFIGLLLGDWRDEQP